MKVKFLLSLCSSASFKLCSCLLYSRIPIIIIVCYRLLIHLLKKVKERKEGTVLHCKSLSYMLWLSIKRILFPIKLCQGLVAVLHYPFSTKRHGPISLVMRCHQIRLLCQEAIWGEAIIWFSTKAVSSLIGLHYVVEIEFILQKLNLRGYSETCMLPIFQPNCRMLNFL